MIIYRSGPISFKVIGWMTPIERIEVANSSKVSSSKIERGCSGLGWIFSNSISLIDDDPLVLSSSIVINASNPRPNADLFSAIF